MENVRIDAQLKNHTLCAHTVQFLCSSNAFIFLRNPFYSVYFFILFELVNESLFDLLLRQYSLAYVLRAMSYSKVGCLTSFIVAMESIIIFRYINLIECKNLMIN